MSEPATTARGPERAERPEQPLEFNDRRTAIGFVVGIVVLALVGVAGGALFRDSCDELFTVGERHTFVQPDPAAVVGAAAADRLRGFGERAGLGVWRGAVALDADSQVVEMPDGFLVFTPGGIDALEPGLSAVNASRGTAGGFARSAFGGAVVGEGAPAPYEVAVFDEDLALIGCGHVTRDEPVLDVDRVRALHATGSTLTSVGLDGDEDWSRGFDAAVTEAHILLGAALVITGEAAELVALGDGSTIRRWELEQPEVLALGPAHAVVSAAGQVARLSLADGALTQLAVDPDAGVTLVDEEVVAGAELPALPEPLSVIDVHSTDGAYAGVEAGAAGGVRWLLLFGPVDGATAS